MKYYDLDNVISELTVGNQLIQTVDKAQKPEPVIEKVFVDKERIVDRVVDKEQIAFREPTQKQPNDDTLMLSIFFSVFGVELSVLAVTSVILVMIYGH